MRKSGTLHDFSSFSKNFYHRQISDQPLARRGSCASLSATFSGGPSFIIFQICETKLLRAENGRRQWSVQGFEILLRNPGWWTTQVFPFFVDFICLEKCWKPVPHDFSWFSEISARVILQECPSLTDFGHFATLIFQYAFKCKRCLAKYDHRYLICEESSYTMT